MFIMNKKIKIAVSLMIFSAVLFLSGCGCKQVNQKKYSLKLEIWGLFDNQDAFMEIIENYKKINPNITDIVYKKMVVETYREDLLEALASGQGPDIFLIQNNWLAKFKDKIAPALPILLTEQKFRKDFVDVVADDFIKRGEIYAVPLSIDTLGLYYNKDFFNEAGITAPPKNWIEFMEDAKKLTRLDNENNIIRSGAAIGTANNISRPMDILTLLMLQGGAQMTDATTGQPSFDQFVKRGNDNFSPGKSALDLYTQFADAKSPVYCWNKNMPFSVDAFSEGRTAMMINYSWKIEEIAAKAPKLNFAVAPVPQWSDMPVVNYPNYWAYVVAKNKIVTNISNNPNQNLIPVNNDVRVGEAWQFLTFLATKPEAAINVTANVAGQQKVMSSNFDPAVSYLEKTKKPAARRDLIEIQKDDSRLGIFALQNLSAKNWYQADSDAIDVFFAEMIDGVNRGVVTSADAIKTAAARLSRL